MAYAPVRSGVSTSASPVDFQPAPHSHQPWADHDNSTPSWAKSYWSCRPRRHRGAGKRPGRPMAIKDTGWRSAHSLRRAPP